MSFRQTNFVSAPGLRPRLVAAVLWVVALCLAVALAWSIREAARLSELTAALRDTASDLRADIAALDPESAALPSASAFAELSSQIEDLNALTGERGVALPRLLEALEQAVPEGVWLSQMTYDADSGAVTLSLLGEEESALPAALQRVEAIPLLGSVILERQVRVRQGQRNVVQYDVQAVAE